MEDIRKLETPDITQKPPIQELAEKNGLRKSGEPRDNMVILAMPGIDPDSLERFKATILPLAQYLPFNVAIITEHVSAISKEDILEWKDKIDHICKVNGWEK